MNDIKISSLLNVRIKVPGDRPQLSAAARAAELLEYAKMHKPASINYTSRQNRDKLDIAGRFPRGGTASPGVTSREDVQKERPV